MRLICGSADGLFRSDLFRFDKVSGPALVDYINASDDGNALLRLRDMAKNTIYVFSHSAAMNGLSEDSRIVSITPWWSITLKVLMSVFAIMTIAFIGLYVRGEVKEVLMQERRRKVNH